MTATLGPHAHRVVQPRRTLRHTSLRDGIPANEGWGQRVDLVRAAPQQVARAAAHHAHAAGRGPLRKRVAEGHMALASGIAGLTQSPAGGHPHEVMVCFKPCPPYAHFKRPGH